ncbi:MAG TPA: pilus assembly protein TadG-related protein [Duganella sp.]|uniref:pilus assembly protein TadG-related protein n=1 Tax=Duganella sp. TaxID=1904440 RepID=UPI002ED51BD4
MEQRVNITVPSPAGGRPSPGPLARRLRQRGAIAILFALMVAGLIGFIGLALDLARVYNRRAELRTIANVAAMAAARSLNGTATGIDNALAQAAVAMSALKYKYDREGISWNDAALSFSSSPNGAWLDHASARGAPNGLAYARAATGNLDIGVIELFFLRVMSDSLRSADVQVTAVAGRSTIDVVPLAVCALSNVEAATRANPGPPANVELVQYGFRRGVAYDLMQLNPNGTVPENFIIDPFSPPGTAGTIGNLATAFVGPYVCTGQLAMPRVFGGTITVGRPFPLASLFNQLNSRFDQYSGSLCSNVTAPPDTNIRSFAFATATPWMTVAPTGQVAASTTTGSQLRTVADPLTKPVGTTAPMYGPLWTYARAVPYSSYVPGSVEPTAGYVAFATSAWGTLYGPAGPTATASYPAGSSTPYKATNGANFLAPAAAHKGSANRRVLNVALLSCPVGGGALNAATVLGVGKFLMTVPATATSLYAEFGGLAAEQTLDGAVELYP